MRLYISKIDNIKVMQGNISTLSSSNKQSTRKDLKKGKNKGVDLGEGDKTLSTDFYILNENDFSRVFKILTKKRKCTLTDKFLGILQVSIKNYKIENSDKHYGYTKISITFTIDEEFNPKIDYRGTILNHVQNIETNSKPQYLARNGDISNQIVDSKIKDDYNEKLDYFMRDLNNVNRDYTFQTIPTPPNLINNDILDFTNNLNIAFNELFFIPLEFKQFKIFTLPYFFGVQAQLLHNLNSNTLLINRLYLGLFLRQLLSVKNAYRLEIVTSVIVRLCNTMQELINNNLIFRDLRIDFNQISNDVINYRNSVDFNQIIELEINHNTLSSKVREYYNSLDNFKDILELNNLHSDIFSNLETFKFYKRLDYAS